MKPNVVLGLTEPIPIETCADLVSMVLMFIDDENDLACNQEPSVLCVGVLCQITLV